MSLSTIGGLLKNEHTPVDYFEEAHTYINKTIRVNIDQCNFAPTSLGKENQ
jgi:hypothetical protein